MLNAVLKELNNFFIRTNNSGIEFQFTVDSTFAADNSITGDFTDTFIVGEYILLEDTRINDGVYLITAIDNASITIDNTIDITLQDEAAVETTFTKLNIPSDLVQLIAEITTYNTNTTDGISSESQGNRSVSFGTSSNGDTSWRQVFNSRLSVYRKLRWC